MQTVRPLQEIKNGLDGIKVNKAEGVAALERVYNANNTEISAASRVDETALQAFHSQNGPEDQAMNLS